MGKKGNVLGLLFLCLVFLLFGCGRESESLSYKIGVIGPLTGEGATYGAAMRRGIDLAVEEINKKGGIGGKKLLPVYEDSKLSPKEGLNAFNKLAQIEKVPVIIGAAASRVTLAITPLAQRNKIVLFSSISTADELKYAGDYFFRNIPPNSVQGETAAFFVLEFLKARNAAIFYKNDDYGKNLAITFRETFVKLGGKIVFEDNYNPGQTDFRGDLVKIKNAHPEVVFFPGNYQESGIILKQARELNLKATFLGGDGSYSPELIHIAGKAAENSYYTLMGMDFEAPLVKGFRRSFREKYGEEPDVYSAYAYDALKTIAEAIRIGGYSSEGIKNALKHIKFIGVTGVTKFDKYGEVNKPYFIVMVKNGKFEFLRWRPSKMTPHIGNLNFKIRTESDK